MSIFYDLIFLIFAVFYLPVFIIRGRWKGSLFMRLGLLPNKLCARLKSGKTIWLHAVSVGEVKAAQPVLEALRKNYPGYQLVVSTVTPTGNKMAKDLCANSDIVIYLPFDFSFVVRKVLKKIKPKLLLIMETEIWPNLILGAQNTGIPVIIINGRISDKAFNRYKLVRGFLKPILDRVELFCMRSNVDAERIITMGADNTKVHVLGNIKYDYSYDLTGAQTTGKILLLQREMGLGTQDLLFVAGSTHKGEEEIIIKTYLSLKNEFKNLKLLLAPRHVNRVREVEELLDSEKIQYCLMSGQGIKHGCDVYVLDTMGSLWQYYALGHVVFIGGSLIKHGGHNPVEAAMWAKPVLFGPFMFNFKEMAEVFLKENAAFEVRDAEMLFERIRGLLQDKNLRAALGSRAQNLVVKNRGVLDKTLTLIAKYL